jgi:hypothetical protein
VLPAGEGDKRLFDDQRGNKPFKLDLEACVVVPGPHGPRLIALGSGSSSRREHIMLVDGIAERQPSVTAIAAHAFYESLRNERHFSGSDLNVEGAVFRDGQLILFGRGNGAPADDRLPLNATCTVDWPSLERHLGTPGAVPPIIEDVVQYELGALNSIDLGFTDATLWEGAMLFAAAAEDSPDARRDGHVSGSVLGIITPDGAVRHCPVVDIHGETFRAKVEGIAHSDERPGCLYALVDQDDPSAPSQLCIIELSGDWRAG